MACHLYCFRLWRTMNIYYRTNCLVVELEQIRKRKRKRKRKRCDIYNYMLLTKIHSEILRVVVDFWFGSGSGCGHTRSTQHGSSSPNWLLASTRSSYRYKCNPAIGYQSYYYKLVVGLFTVEFLKLYSTVPWLTSPNNRGGNK
jgi:hypothetical protein